MAFDDQAGTSVTIDYIVVSYQSARDIGACLDSISTDRGSDSRVIVIDNASSDGSANLATSHPTHPTVIRNSANVGFGAACNQAASISNGDVLFFLNPDARLVPGASEHLIAGLLHGRTAATGPRTVDPLGQYRVASAGAEPSLRSVIGHYWLIGRVPLIRRLFLPLHLARADRERDVDWVGGAAMCVRRDAFQSVGGFDSARFLYMEDVDLCRRLRERRWTIRYSPEATVEHRIGGSQSSGQAARWYEQFHSYLVVRSSPFAARLADAVVCTGMIGRWLAYRRGRPEHARRMKDAAAASWSVLLGRSPSTGRR